MEEPKTEQLSVTLSISRGETSGTKFVLTQGENLVGRWDPDQGIFPEVDLENHDPEAKVSRRHATIFLGENGLSVEDMGSLNGTFVNRGKRLEQGKATSLKDGDELIFGKTFLVVRVQE